jgi:Domain of unknown function (DUF6471)
VTLDAINSVTNALNMATLSTIVNGKRNAYDGIGIVGGMMKTEDEWAEDVKRLLRAEMARRGITYDELAEKLAAIGVRDSPVNLRNKVSRGRFAATFLVQCLVAMGAHSLWLDSERASD